MKITKWQMFVAWLKQRDLLVWCFLGVLLLARWVSDETYVLGFIAIIIQAILIFLFLRYAIREVFPKDTPKKTIIKFIIYVTIVPIGVDILNFVFYDNFINLFVILLAVVIAIPAIASFIKLTPKSK